MRKVKVTKGATPLYHQKPSGALHDGFQVEKQPEPTINNAAKEVDKDEANVEAEKGEVVYSPSNPQLKLINGKSHKKGGTLLNLDQGDFVFSHYLKMGGEEQQIIGVEPKENVSYADALKQNVKPFNKAVHLMNTSEDMYDKNTATFTLKESLKKIEQLALMQELKKGMPNGTPAFMEQPDAEPPMAKYGGMQYMQKAGTVIQKKKFEQVNGKTVEAEKRNKKDIPKNAKEIIPGQLFGTSSETVTRGQDRTNESTRNKLFNDTYRKYNRGKDNYIQDEIKQGRARINPKTNKVEFNIGKNNSGVKPGWYDAERPYEKKTVKEDYYYVEDDSPTTTPVPTKTSEGTSGTTPVGGGGGQTTKKDELTSGDSGEIYYNDERDLGYGWMDKLSVDAPWMMGNRKFAPILRQAKLKTPNVRYVDFEAERQSMKGMASTLGRQNNLTGTGSMNASRNSELLGKVLNPINESFQNEFNTNNQIYNQAELQSIDIKNREALSNAAANAKYDTDYAQMNENYQAGENIRKQQIFEAINAAEKGRLEKTYANMITPDYSIDENGNIDRKATDAKRALAKIKAGKKQGSSETFEQWYRKNGMDKIKGMNPDRAINAWAKINSTKS